MNALGILVGGILFAISMFLLEALVLMVAVKALLNPELLVTLFGTFGFGKACLLALLLKIPAGFIKYAHKS